MTIAAQLSAPPRGANAPSVAEANARGRARLDAWRDRAPRRVSEVRELEAAQVPRTSFEACVLERARIRHAEERWQELDVCSIDRAGEIAIEHRRFCQANGISAADLYVMIEGRDPPTHLTPDDVFALLVCAYLTVQRSSSSHAQPARGRVTG